MLLATAKALSRFTPAATVQFADFTLEEPQTGLDAYRHGSRHFSGCSRSEGRRYEGVFILEVVGYTDRRLGSQVRPRGICTGGPDRGGFLRRGGPFTALPIFQITPAVSLP